MGNTDKAWYFLFHFFPFLLLFFGEDHKGGKVDLGGLGHGCEQGALCEILQ